MKTEVVRNRECGRYEISVDGESAGYADYHEEAESVVLPHTVIDPARRGLGLAAILIRYALDDIAHSGRQVVPACWYVAGFIDRHPEYRYMLVDTAPPGRSAEAPSAPAQLTQCVDTCAQ